VIVFIIYSHDGKDTVVKIHPSLLIFNVTLEHNKQIFELKLAAYHSMLQRIDTDIILSLNSDMVSIDTHNEDRMQKK
jgi:hypothetical protein